MRSSPAPALIVSLPAPPIAMSLPAPLLIVSPLPIASSIDHTTRGPRKTPSVWSSGSAETR